MIFNDFNSALILKICLIFLLNECNVFQKTNLLILGEDGSLRIFGLKKDISEHWLEKCGANYFLSHVYNLGPKRKRSRKQSGIYVLH